MAGVQGSLPLGDVVVDLPRPPAEVSVGGLASFARCPRQGRWLTAAPRSRAVGAAAALGASVHRRIARAGSDQPSLLDESEPEASPAVARLESAFLASPYGGLRPRLVEASFALPIGGWRVRGRLDAAYERAGRFEVVDFKTGRPPAPDDGGAGRQIELYALAAVDVWRRPPSRVRGTYWYLSSGRGVSRDFDDASIAATRGAVTTDLAELGAGRSDPRPGSYCAFCDFTSACPEGAGFLERLLGARSGVPGG